MHLSELLVRRQVPAAGIFLALTKRCPMACLHCSTRSEKTSAQLPAALLRRFTATFTVADHPDYLLMTGGEPLLRPRLVRELAATARAAGTGSYLLTGAYFAAARRTPARIAAALRSVDHVAVSIDSFHEATVGRAAVFRVLREVLDSGRDASIQACGTGAADSYVADLTGQVRREFGDRVPMLVTTLRPVGRAADWMGAMPAARHAPAPGSGAAPCDLAAWPVVGFDGTIAACCNTDVLEAAETPAHLRLGHISGTTWPEVRRAAVSSPVLRVLRTHGPVQLARWYGAPAGDSYCGTCRSLAGYPGVRHAAVDEVARPSFALTERQARSYGPEAFTRRHGAVMSS